MHGLTLKVAAVRISGSPDSPSVLLEAMNGGRYPVSDGLRRGFLTLSAVDLVETIGATIVLAPGGFVTRLVPAERDDEIDGEIEGVRASRGDASADTRPSAETASIIDAIIAESEQIRRDRDDDRNDDRNDDRGPGGKASAPRRRVRE